MLGHVYFQNSLYIRIVHPYTLLSFTLLTSSLRASISSAQIIQHKPKLRISSCLTLMCVQRSVYDQWKTHMYNTSTSKTHATRSLVLHYSHEYTHVSECNCLCNPLIFMDLCVATQVMYCNKSCSKVTQNRQHLFMCWEHAWTPCYVCELKTRTPRARTNVSISSPQLCCVTAITFQISTIHTCAQLHSHTTCESFV